MTLSALVVVGLWATSSAALADRRVALVVGNGSYATLGTLANPTNDADDIAATLRGMGFAVTLAENANERDFTDALSNFATAADGADVALFYYSGHGLQYASENYLVPVDALLRNRFSLTHETIALNDVLAAMSGAHTSLVYVDACRSFPISGTFFASPNERVTPVAGLAPVEQVRNTFVGFSASAGQTARDGSGRNSPFTTAMLETLPTPGLGVSEMFSAVTADVISSTDGAQKPQSFSGISTDLALVAGGASTAQASATPTEEERAYHDVVAIGTIDAFRAYIARYPGGLYSELARAAMNKLLAGTQTPPAEPAASSSAQPDVAAVATKPSTLSLPPGLKEANFSAFGKSTAPVGNWKIAQGKGQCSMYTEAVGVSPAGWLQYRPWFYFTTKTSGSLVLHAMFTTNKADGSDLLAPGSATATVTMADGHSQQIPALFRGSELAMLSPCAEGSTDQCIDDDGVTALMAGHLLTVTGRTPQGKDASITYDISGYTDAAMRINALCKAKVQYLFGETAPDDSSDPAGDQSPPPVSNEPTPSVSIKPGSPLVGSWSIFEVGSVACGTGSIDFTQTSQGLLHGHAVFGRFVSDFDSVHVSGNSVAFGYNYTDAFGQAASVFLKGTLNDGGNTVTGSLDGKWEHGCTFTMHKL